MSLGLKKYEDEIKKAWGTVLDDKNETDWSMFGYDGQSNDLKVLSTGQYGLEELQQEFNPGKVLYAFAKVLNPKTNLPCFILISWVGEGSPLSRKSSSPNHSIELKKFLKYSSLTINARLEEEVEPDSILEKIRKSSTTEFNFSIKSDDTTLDRLEPVSTNHVRIRPEQDLNLKEKTKFWSKLDEEKKMKQEEENRKQKEQKLNERNLISNNRKKLEKLAPVAEHMANRIDKLQLNNEILNEREQFWAEQKAEEKKRHDEENRKRLLEKRKIESEIRNLSENNAKQIMNTFNNPTSTTNQVKKINAIDEINLEKKKVLSSIKNTLQTSNKENTEMNIPVEDEDSHQLGDLNDDLNDEIVIHEEDESLSENDLKNNHTFTFPKDQHSPQPNTDLPENEYYKLQAEYCGNNDNQTYLIDQRINEEDELYDEEYENEYCLDNGLTSPYTSYLSKRLSNEPLEDIAEEDEDCLDLQEDKDCADFQNDEELREYIQDKGVCARALFDYQASDQTEISFQPGDILTHIDQVYETWWTGTTGDGKIGLFPSNFVQLLELN